MKNMNLLPAFRYRVMDSLFDSGVFFGIMVLATILFSGLIIGFSGENSGGSITAFTFSASIMSFVLGITSVREDLRLSIQHGVSRKTTFVSGICSALCVGFALALAGEILLAVSQAAVKDVANFYVTDLFQMIYLDSLSRQLSLAQHAQALLFGLSIYFCACMAGMLISLVFYRLSKPWTVVVAVGVPLFFAVGLPAIVFKTGLWKIIGKPVAAFFEWLSLSYSSAVLFFFACAFVLAFFSYLLIRRAPIKPAAG